MLTEEERQRLLKITTLKEEILALIQKDYDEMDAADLMFAMTTFTGMLAKHIGVPVEQATELLTECMNDEDMEGSTSVRH